MFSYLALISPRGDEIWRIPGPFPRPLAAGLIVALESLLENSDNYGGETFLLINNETGNVLISKNGRARIDVAGRFNTAFTSIDRLNKRFSDDTKIDYGVWIISKNGWAQLYDFSTLDQLSRFIQGVITITNAFGVPPKEVIIASPLHKKEYLRIEGVDLPLLPE